MVRHLLEERVSTYRMEGKVFDLENLRVSNESSNVNISIKNVLYRIPDRQAFKKHFFRKTSPGICNRIGFLGSH